MTTTVTVLSILGALSLLVITLIILMKTGVIKDKDKNLIPDELEDIYSKIDSRVEELKLEYKDVKQAVEELKEQLKDLQDAAKGKKRRGRKPKK